MDQPASDEEEYLSWVSAGEAETGLENSKQERDGCCKCWWQHRHICCCYGPRVSFAGCCCCYCLVIYFLLAAPIYYLHHQLVYPGWTLKAESMLSACENEFSFRSSYDNALLQAVNQPLLTDTYSCDLPDAHKVTVLFFCGNGCDMWQAMDIAGAVVAEIPKVAGMGQQVVLNVFSSSYRGYPPNKGWSSRASLLSDARDLLDCALRNSSAAGRALVVGWSLGSAVSLQLALAEKDRIAGLLLLNPFSSLSEETNVFIDSQFGMRGKILLWPWLWAMNLDPLDSLTAVSTLSPEVPVAVVSSQQDEVIPHEQHLKVFEASHATCRQFLPVAGAGHASFTRMRVALEGPPHRKSSSMDDPVSSCPTMADWSRTVLDRTGTSLSKVV
eukprot:TRINITY_DN25535_c0_g1_i2.p1 TRINITY_DN25535_c0_g1~~TRINITY_DN25535_c0_g1_i2.p1  ORF type:complete len:393 (+),score=64.16 TRINITY_DN25535_c0_g1_i2:26-1180(+)